MIYVVVCDYCGDRIVTPESGMEHVSLRCVICKSKRRVQKHEVVDGYKDCPPFPEKTKVVAEKPKTEEPKSVDLDKDPDWSEVTYPGSYGDLYDAYGY